MVKCNYPLFPIKLLFGNGYQNEETRAPCYHLEVNWLFNILIVTVKWL